MSAPTPLSKGRVTHLRHKFPMLPEAYFAHLLRVGWGKAESGRMIYDGPMLPSEVYGPRVFEDEFVLLGDDFQGYCLAVQLTSGTLGELSPRGEWEEWPPFETFESYVAR